MSSKASLVLCITIYALVYASQVKGTYHRFNVNITESGNTFIERIDISGNTVTYHVPSHNNVEKSDLLVNYKKKLTVIRIPRLRECHVESMSDDESSPLKVMFDLVKVKRSYQKRSPDVRTVDRTVIKIGKFKNASTTVKKFCGVYPIFWTEIIDVAEVTNTSQSEQDIKEPQIQMVTTKLLLHRLSKFYDSTYDDTDDEGDDDNDDASSGSGNASQASGDLVPIAGYGSGEVGPGRRLYKAFSPGLCGNLGTMADKMLDCIDDPKEWDMKTTRESATCSYRIYCRPRKIVDGKLYQEHCYEKHERSTNVCYDISCKTKETVHV